MRKCKCGCGLDISHKHKNAKFFNKKHKDKFWNRENPRGFYQHLNQNDPDYYLSLGETHPFEGLNDESYKKY